MKRHRGGRTVEFLLRSARGEDHRREQKNVGDRWLATEVIVQVIDQAPEPGSSRDPAAAVSVDAVSHWSTDPGVDHSTRYIRLRPPWTVPWTYEPPCWSYTRACTLTHACIYARERRGRLRCVRAYAGWKSRPTIIYTLVICHNRRPPLCNLTISLRSNGNAYRALSFLCLAPSSSFSLTLCLGNATTVISLWIWWREFLFIFAPLPILRLLFLKDREADAPASNPSFVTIPRYMRRTCWSKA